MNVESLIYINNNDVSKLLGLNATQVLKFINSYKTFDYEILEEISNNHSFSVFSKADSISFEKTDFQYYVHFSFFENVKYAIDNIISSIDILQNTGNKFSSEIKLLNNISKTLYKELINIDKLKAAKVVYLPALTNANLISVEDIKDLGSNKNITEITSLTDLETFIDSDPINPMLYIYNSDNDKFIFTTIVPLKDFKLIIAISDKD